MNPETLIGVLVAVIQLLVGYVLQGIKGDIKSIVTKFDTFIAQTATHEADIKNFRERIARLEQDVERLKILHNGNTQTR